MTCTQDQSKAVQGCIMVGLYTNLRDLHPETVIFTTLDLIHVEIQRNTLVMKAYKALGEEHM